MWVVKRIGFIQQNGKTIYSTFQFMSSPVLNTSNTVVHLSESVSGDMEVLYSRDKQNYLSKLKSLHPYGFVDNNVGLSAVTQENNLVVIDDLSLQFLGYVDSVDEVYVSDSDSKHGFVANLASSFVGLDSELSLFVVDTLDRCACTLFHAICFCSTGWLGDEFYLYSRRMLDPAGRGLDYADVVYRVRFCDVVGAKRLLTKAVVNGINPVRDFAKSEFF